MSAKAKYNIILIFLVVSMLGSAYFSIMGLLNPQKILPVGTVLNESGIIFARYMAVRNLAIIAITALVGV